VCEADAQLLTDALSGLSIIDLVGKRVRTDLIRKAEHQARVLLCTRTLLDAAKSES
jgi:hypothetical protein